MKLGEGGGAGNLPKFWSMSSLWVKVRVPSENDPASRADGEWMTPM